LSATIQNLWSANKLAIAICFCLLTGSTVLWLWGFNTNSFTRRDAYDYAQLSTEVFTGKGLSTLQVFPRHLPYFQEKGFLESGYWPNLYRSPLLTVTNVLFRWLTEDVVVSLVIQSGFWYLASIPLFFFLAKHLTNLRVALASTLLYIGDPVIILYSYSGMTETLATFLLLGLFVVAYWGDSNPWKWGLIGLLSSLAYLARAQFVILFPLILLYVWIKAPKSARITALVFVLAGLLLALGPWLLRNVSITGDPLFSFTNSRNLVLDAIPGHSDLEMQLHAPVDLFIILRQMGGPILSKFIRNTSGNLFSFAYWTNSFRGPFLFLLLFFFITLVNRQVPFHRDFKDLKWSTLVLILSSFLVISLTVYSVRSYLMFRPLIFLVSIGGIELLLQRFSRSTQLLRLSMGLLTGLAVFQLGAAITAHQHLAARESAFDRKAYEILKNELHITRKTVIASDISERISSNVGSRTLRLPSNPAELLEIDQNYLPVDYVLLSKELLADSLAVEGETNYHETYGDYINFIDSPDFRQAFPDERRLPNGSLLFKSKDLEE
jgi:4-amino-4-deoxy-L-arabinose transferase-like glycosyltransferase